MSDKNVTYKVSEVLGFSTKMETLLTTLKTDMVAAKVDPTDLIAKLKPGRDSLTTQNEKHESLKQQLKDQTITVNGLNTTAYNDASAGVGKIEAAFGKNSAQFREATALRKAVRPVSRNSGNTPAPATQSK